MNIPEEIQKLGFPLDEYIVVGSGSMAAHGLREAGDLDLVATPALFEKCVQEGWEKIAWTKPEKIGQHYLRKGEVEIYLDVNKGNFNPTFDELVSRSEVIDGMRYMSLHDVVDFKKVYSRPKDSEDIRLIEAYFNDKKAH